MNGKWALLLSGSAKRRIEVCAAEWGAARSNHWSPVPVGQKRATTIGKGVRKWALGHLGSSLKLKCDILLFHC